MNTIKSSGPALIVIDVQKGIDEADHWGGNRNNPGAEGNIELLMAYWQKMKYPVFIVQHCSVTPTSPFFPGKEGNALKDFVAVQKAANLIQKKSANAFVGTTLENQLNEMGVVDVYIVGFITNNSVEATARMAGDLGFKTTVVDDATATFSKKGLNGTIHSSDLIHQISLANLAGEYAAIRSTFQVLEGLKN